MHRILTLLVREQVDFTSEGIPNEQVVEKVGGLRLPVSRSSPRELCAKTATEAIIPKTYEARNVIVRNGGA